MHSAILFQVIYLLLHGVVVVLSLGHVIAHMGVAFARLGGMYTPLSIPFITSILLRIKKITLSLGPCGFCSLGIYLAWVLLLWT